MVNNANVLVDTICQKLWQHPLIKKLKTSTLPQTDGRIAFPTADQALSTEYQPRFTPSQRENHNLLRLVNTATSKMQQLLDQTDVDLLKSQIIMILTELKHDIDSIKLNPLYRYSSLLYDIESFQSQLIKLIKLNKQYLNFSKPHEIVKMFQDDLMLRYSRIIQYTHPNADKCEREVVVDWVRDKFKINGDKRIEALTSDQPEHDNYRKVYNYIMSTTGVNQARAEVLAYVLTQHCYTGFVIPLQLSCLSHDLLIAPDSRLAERSINYSTDKLTISCKCNFRDQAGAIIYTMVNTYVLQWLDASSNRLLLVDFNYAIEYKDPSKNKMTLKIYKEFEGLKSSIKPIIQNLKSESFKLMMHTILKMTYEQTNPDTWSDTDSGTGSLPRTPELDRRVIRDQV